MNPTEEEGICSSFPVNSKTLSPSDFRAYVDSTFSDLEFDMENSVHFNCTGNEPADFFPGDLESLVGFPGSMPPSCPPPKPSLPPSKSCFSEQFTMVVKEQGPSSPSSPSPLSDDEDWEESLSSLIGSEEDQRVVPSMDPKTLETLLTIPIRDFNSRTKSMKIDPQTLQHLKACRKRRKNRDAAIRSRSRKEQEVVTLRSRVELLLKENQDQKRMIESLLAKIQSSQS